MSTQESQFECDIRVHFVVPKSCKSENDCGEEMWQAFNRCSELGLQTEWITENFCNEMDVSKSDVFIIEEFKGDLFEKLKNFKCSRIVSPKCLLICLLNGESIPEGSSPIYTTAMRGMCICASGLSPESKNQIKQQIEYMGGFFTKHLRDSVTHLVADSVMSAKYEAAVKMKMPIMTKKWVEAVWEANLKLVVKADDKIFDKYKCPVFMNLIVTSTNLPKCQKEEIKNLIHDHGGTFMGPLDGSTVRVVVTPENGPLSQKLKYAMDNDIACLKVDWVYQSIKVGYALPFRDFIKSVKACSTPEKSNNRETLNCSEISSIPYDKALNSYISESFYSSNASITTDIINNFSDTAVLNVLDRLTLSEVKSAGPFLDGCNIYLAGFAANVRDKLNKILNVGGATRLDEISDAVTHVIVGDENKASAELKAMKSRGLCPYILSINWLEESIKLKRPISEELFLFETKGTTLKSNTETLASPLSKKNLQMLQQSRRPPVPLFNLKDLTLKNEEQQPNLVQQYLQETSERKSTTREFTKTFYKDMPLEDENQSNVNNTKDTRVSQIRLSNIVQARNTGNEYSEVPLSQSYKINEKLLKGLTFIVTGFDNDDNHVEETIVMLGGRMISKTYSGIPDYGVVPVHGAPLKHTVNEIVTDLFLEDCINQEQIVDIMYYHRPLSIRNPCNPLSGCVITMSMYTGTERVYLSTLAVKLGGICQDMFARIANADRTRKDTLGNTHLICPTPEGNKYNAAVRWKLPAVTADWLKTCAEQLAFVDETPFLVGETMAPDRSKFNANFNGTSFPNKDLENTTSLTDKVITRTVLTPKRHLSQVKTQDIQSETPLINKRLSLITNQTSHPSPFHISTPESPYGQVFEPNPSPDTRKRWIKFADNFLDLRVSEPPLKRRLPSTPLSELKKQLWGKLMDAAQSELENNEKTERVEKAEVGRADTINNQSNKDAPSTPTLPTISRKLEYDEDNSPVSTKLSNEINMQIAQLDQMLQRTSSTPENRYSLSGENAKKYNDEVSDHIQKCIIKDSQPIDAIVWEDPDHPKRITIRINEDNRSNMNAEECINDAITEHKPEITRKFMLSGIKDKNVYEQVIKELGGDVSTCASFDNSATHLLCVRPSRNEKMLSSIAAGKWVLHCSYLRASERAGKFLNEEEYEWGNLKSKGIIPELSGECEQAIAAAAYKWRVKLRQEPDGPFSDMIALLMVSGEKYDQFKRLIEAGGGLVMQARPPYDTSPSGRRITHCFVNVKQMNQPIDWAMLASKGILCFLPQYLSDYLTAVNPLNPRDCVVPEFKKYLKLLPK